MSDESIAIASDHAGVELKAFLKQELEGLGYQVIDFGTDDSDSVDYPDFAKKVVKSMKEGEAAKGILICGSGIGMSIASNRYPFIRAALVRDIDDAILSRQHNDANVLVLGARRTEAKDALDIMKIFLTTPFMEGRHIARVKKLSDTEI